MKKLLLLLFLPVFLGGKPTKINIDNCDCPSYADTVLPELITEFIAPIVAETVDSFRSVKQRQLDSLNIIKDSLHVEIITLKREKSKKLIVGHVDLVDGQGWKWLYWKYPDGEKRFYKVVKFYYRIPETYK